MRHGDEHAAPYDAGVQRLVIDTQILHVSGPPLPQVEVLAPLSASWYFDSDSDGWHPIWNFSMHFAGRTYTQDDVIEAEMAIFRGTDGLAGTIVLADALLPSPLSLTFFEEFGESNLTLAFSNGTQVSAGMNGWYERVSEVPEPDSPILVLAALLALCAFGARRPAGRSMARPPMRPQTASM